MNKNGKFKGLFNGFGKGKNARVYKCKPSLILPQYIFVLLVWMPLLKIVMFAVPSQDITSVVIVGTVIGISLQIYCVIILRQNISRMMANMIRR